jgi:hypothetical protein
MNKDSLLRLLNHKYVQTYGFNIGFFIVFSIFLIFAIRPNLITAFSLQKELQDLKLKNKKSEEVILQVVNYQSTLEEYRDKLPLLDQAVPSAPTVAQVVDEVRRSASDSGILINSLSVESIDLKGMSTDENEESPPEEESSTDQSGNQVASLTTNSFTIDLVGSAHINEVSSFLDKLMLQRRLKRIESVVLIESQDGGVTITISLYYL